MHALNTSPKGMNARSTQKNLKIDIAARPVALLAELVDKAQPNTTLLTQNKCSNTTSQ